MRSRLIAFAVALMALSCCAAALIAPSTAGATQPGVELSINGSAFGASADGPLLDVDRLVPGATTSAVLGVRSRMPELATLHLRLHDVSDDDNGCVGPERAVDVTCGAGQGDLGRTLRFTIVSAADQHGPYTTSWAGTIGQLEDDVDTGLQILPGDARWLRLSAALPGAAGNVVESDTFGFGLTVSLVGTTTTAQAEAASAHRGGTHSHAGSGTAFGADSASSSPLASTGFAVLLYVVAAGLLIAAGAMLVLTARRRRRAAIG